MPKYNVLVEVRGKIWVPVEADNPDRAEAAATDLIWRNDPDVNLDYLDLATVDHICIELVSEDEDE